MLQAVHVALARFFEQLAELLLDASILLFFGLLCVRSWISSVIIEAFPEILTGWAWMLDHQ